MGSSGLRGGSWEGGEERGGFDVMVRNWDWGRLRRHREVRRFGPMPRSIRVEGVRRDMVDCCCEEESGGEEGGGLM
jgi:hypothetical protein